MALPLRCSIQNHKGEQCPNPVDAATTLNLCPNHLLAAYDLVAAEVGMTDVLPSPCVACGSRLGVRFPSGWLCAICEWRLGETPDSEQVHTRVDVVYYLRFEDKVKIGTSGNPRSRLTQLRFDELLAFERGNRAREHQRHLQFADYRIAGGEWFTVHDALEAHIHELQRGVDDPWNTYRLWVSEAIARTR